MILRPTKQDLRNIGYYLGRVVIGLAWTMLLPAILGFAAGEISPAFDFIIAFQISLLAGLTLIFVCQRKTELNWMQGMIVVSLSWLAAMALGAIPMYLSGHWRCFLDACFDSMSGFATTGLALVEDLDHLSFAHNLWRHLIMFIGGQGIIIIALSLLIKGASGAFTMYVGEARDERVLPNVAHTAQFIWTVSLVYLGLGTLTLVAAGIFSGLRPLSALFHGICLFMAAFDTGGFTPQSQSMLYYHSAPYEIITVVIMIFGALNFKLHYHLWVGNRKEIFKNIETVSFFVSVAVLFFLTVVGLRKAQVYSHFWVLLRKGFYQFISAHTGTGYQTLYSQRLGAEWSDLSMAGLILAMGLGGAVCSTTGAIKMLRLGIIAKALVENIKRVIMPEKAVVAQKFHHIKEILLQDKQVRLATFVTLGYFLLYGLGSLVGMFYGYPFLAAVFESTSARPHLEYVGKL